MALRTFLAAPRRGRSGEGGPVVREGGCGEILNLEVVEMGEIVEE